MWIKRNYAQKLYGHDLIEIFESINTPEAYAYLKDYLSKKYPQLGAIDIESKEDWLHQTARLLNIPYDKLVSELEVQMLRSYLINKNYNELLDTLADEDVPMWKKEMIYPGISFLTWARGVSTLLFGLKQAAFLIMPGYVITLVLTLTPALIFNWWGELWVFLAYTVFCFTSYFFLGKERIGASMNKVHDKFIGR